MDVKLLPYQYEFITSSDPNLVLTAGVGTGKTLAAAYFILRMVSEYPHSKGMICAPTWAQLENTILATLISVCDDHSIPYKTSLGTKKQIKILNTTIYLYSLERPDTIRGIEVGWILAEEFFFNKVKHSYDVVKTRLRDKKGPRLFRGITTKNGFNWGYNTWAAPDRKNTFKTINAQTKDNHHLPDDYLEQLLEDYGSVDAPMYKQEVLNEYVNLTHGAVYYSFNRDIHVKLCNLDPTKHVYVGCDFNIDNVNALLIQYRNGTFYICKEISLTEKDANTFSLAETLSEDLFNFPFRSIIPDSTGKARKTSSTKSDHQILRDSGFKVENTSNPLIRDRQNAVNRSFFRNKVVIDPSCKKLIKELETLASRDDEGAKAHISVALGYVVWKLDPIKRPTGTFRSY